MTIYIKKPGGTWSSSVSAVYAKNTTWRTVSAAYVKVSGAWRKFFPDLLTPAIESTVEISRNNATYPSTLTGTNYHWNDSTSLTYVFQKSSDNVSWSNIGTASSISNPSSGSSNTVTYALTLSDFPAFTSYYRFVVTATNSTYSTTATSTSTSVSVNRPAPINTVLPVISPSSGTAGTTTFSVTNGTWNPDDADGVYEYQWQYYDGASVYLNISGATSSTYAPATNYVTIYGSFLRCRVTATNASGSTQAFAVSVTVSAPTPTGGSVAISPTGSQFAGTTLTAATTGWTNSPTSYSVRIYASSTNPPTTSSTLKASSTSSSVTYAITSADANSGLYFKAFATATNGGGTSAEVGSNVVTSIAPTASNLTTADSTITPGTPSSITVANTANANEGKVSWTNGANATSSWVSSVTPGSSYTGTDGGTLLTQQLFTITSSTTATATVNNKNNNKRVTISWDQSNAASYSVNYTITNAGLANGTYNSTGNSTASSASIVVTLGNVSGTVRANSVTVYSQASSAGASNTFTPPSAPSTSPTDKTSSGTGNGTVTFTQPALPAPTFGANTIFFGGFSGFINNYSVSNTYSVATSQGTLTIGSPPTSGSTYAFSVSGLTVGQSATVTVTVSRSGYTGSSGSTTSKASTYYIRARGLGNTTAPYIEFVVGAAGAQSISINLGRSTANGGLKTYLGARQTYNLTSGVSAALQFSSRTGTTSNWYVLDVMAYSGANATGSLLASFASTSDKQGSDTTTSTVYYSST
jgi:hypothetical protein